MGEHGVFPCSRRSMGALRMPAAVGLDPAGAAGCRAAAVRQGDDAVGPGDGPGATVAGGRRALDRIARLTRGAREEVMTFAPDGEHTPESVAAARPLDEDLLGRGVRMRTVPLDGTRDSPHVRAYAQWPADRGGERTVAVLPVRMVVVDRARAVAPGDGEGAAAGALVLTGQGAVAALCALCARVRQDARPVGPADGCGPGGLTGTEAAAVKLLAEGCTDEAIAKRLGVSARTARRVATGLMQRLDARSRFEAGVRAVQRGWIR